MPEHRIGTREEWQAAREELLKAEKRLSSKEPFASPWASTRTWCANEATSRSACGREPAKLSHASLGFRISARFGGVMCGAAGP